ncbi:cytidyltransferase-like protein [Anaerotaenia torta]|uniref:adenylyltransferase/cytidyltransferase family protein n=1 Tax=Anaerotaenia torta TaxID=433293 RepID=UPI003D1CC324
MQRIIDKNHIKVRTANMLHVIKPEEVTRENIEKIFMDFPEDCIYCVDDNLKYLGVITLGAWSRSIEVKNEDWINYNSKKIIEGGTSGHSINEAHDIFTSFNKVNRVPVLNEYHQIVYEYYYDSEQLENDAKLQLLWNELQIVPNLRLNNYLMANHFDNVLFVGKSSLLYSIYCFFNSQGDAKCFIGDTNEWECKEILPTRSLIISENRFIKVDLEDNKIIRLSEFIRDLYKIYKYLHVEDVFKKRGLFSVYARVPNKFAKEEGLIYTTEERERIIKGITIADVVNNIELYEDFTEDIYGEYYHPDYVSALSKIPPVIKKWGKYIHSDISSDYVNVFSGQRKTCDQPVVYHNKIHVFGTCYAFGYAVEDAHTICSFLQRLINEEYKDTLCVCNYGVQGIAENVFDNMWNTEYRKGDLAVYASGSSQRVINTIAHCGGSIIDFTPLYESRPKNCFFNLPGHCNHIMNKKMAEYLFVEVVQKYLRDINSVDKESNYFDNEKVFFSTATNEYLENESELKLYLSLLEKYRIDDKRKRLGAIVMNCNPFTKGHKYLIATSAKKVDYLYIFVVEEDKSFFPFKDRFKLVKEGTKDIPNVIVVPSGKLIISALTFPGYFVKDNPGEVKIDTSTDIEIFSKYIAPALNIKIRFVGEEPFDIVTRQYNESMKSILPQYDIEFSEIPRHTVNENVVVSASLVRKYLKEKEFDKIKDLVPETTYQYLAEKFFDNKSR